MCYLRITVQCIGSSGRCSRLQRVSFLKQCNRYFFNVKRVIKSFLIIALTLLLPFHIRFTTPVSNQIKLSIRFWGFFERSARIGPIYRKGIRYFASNDSELFYNDQKFQFFLIFLFHYFFNGVFLFGFVYASFQMRCSVTNVNGV